MLVTSRAARVPKDREAEAQNGEIIGSWNAPRSIEIPQPPTAATLEWCYETLTQEKKDMTVVKDNKKEYDPAPEGLHQAVCVDEIDVGMQDSPWGQIHKIELRWQIEEINPKNGKPYLVVARYTASLNKKSNLCKHLEAWRGRKFTPEEKEGFDLANLIGVNCQLQIEHNVTENGTYANIQAIVPVRKGMEKLQPIDYERVKDRKDGNNNGQERYEPAAEYDEEPTPF